MSETYNVEVAIKAQEKYCNDNNYPLFSPCSGRCCRCHQQIYSPLKHEGKDYITGISVERASSELITGCPHYHFSFCE